MSNVLQFTRRAAVATPTQLLKVMLPGTRIEAEVTLSPTDQGWESHVFYWGHWEAGGACDTRDDALKAALNSLCELLFRVTTGGDQ